MTSETPPYSGPIMDDVIDLRPYLLALVRAWPLLLGCTLAAALIAAAFIVTRPPTYEASVNVAIVEYRTKFSLEPSLETVQDTTAQRAALGALVKNPAIAERVLEEVGDNLPKEYQDVSELMKMVTTNSEQSDIIRIAVHASDPDVAVSVATAWASAYEQHINDLYEGLAPGTLEALVEQTEIAQGEYEEAQDALVQFTRASSISTLERRISDLESVRTGQMQDRTTLLSQSLAERRRLQHLLDDATALLDQVEQAGNAGTASSALAITLLKTEVYASEKLPGGLTLDMTSAPQSESNAREQATDLKALVGSLERAIAALDEDIHEQVAGLASSEDHVIAALGPDASGARSLEEIEGTIQELRAELEEARAQEQELTRTRDVALETYSALARKVSEQRVESGLVPSVVRVASKAMRSSKPEGRSTLQYVVLAGVAGFMLASLFVFLLTYLYPDIAIWDVFRRRTSGAETS